MKYTLLLLPMALLFTNVATAQRIPLVDSGQVMERATELQDSQKFELAIKHLLTIPQRDTNFVASQSRLAALYALNEQYDLAASTADAILKEPSEHKSAIWRVKAYVYEKRKEFDKAIAVVQAGLNEYPFDIELRFQLGTIYHNMHDYKSATKAYYDVLAIYPFSASTHLNLGNVALWAGDKTHAMMSYGVYLSLMSTDNEKLRLLESIASNQADQEGQGAAQKANNNAYDRLDQILRSKIAMDPKFKTEVPVDVATVRQFEMLFRELGTASTTVDDPWMKYYGPVYGALRDKKMIEPFLYHLLESSSIESVKKWTSKNTKKLDAYFEVMNPLLLRNRGMVDVPASLGIPSPAHAEYNENFLEGIGGMTNDQKQGKWLYYHTNGPRSAEGTYNNGKKTGDWKYYSDDGILITTENHDTGEVTDWYPDGVKKVHYMTKGGSIEGEIVFYYPCGNISERRTHRDGKRTGKGQMLYENGTLKSEFEYADDKLSGTWTDYDVNGKVKAKYSYKNGVRDGLNERYWPNGKLRQREQMVEGKINGVSEGYHDNGTVHYKGQYVNDLPVGTWIYQYRNNIKYEQRFYNEQGDPDKENIFYHEGKAYVKHIYNKGTLVQVAGIGEDDKEDQKFGSPDGTFDCKHYFPNGQLLSEGKYKKGKREGKWTQYFIDGQIESVYTYVDGVYDGEQVDYYRSGIKSSVIQYKNGARDGYQQEFHPNGKVSSEGWERNGNEQQQWLMYYADGTIAEDRYYRDGNLADTLYTYSVDGQIVSRDFYVEGTRTIENNFNPLEQVYFMGPKTDGEQIVKYPSGTVLSRYPATCGTLNGSLERFWPDGKKFYSYPYINNTINGLYTAYSLEGYVTETGEYLSDSQHGTWKYYNNVGKLNRVSTYVNGTIDSVSTTYYAFGNPYQVSEYVDGKRTGLIRYLAPDGTPIVEKKSIWNQLMAVRTLEKNGQFGSWRPFSANMNIVAYYSGGAKAYEEEYKSGTLSGAKRIYFSNGKLCMEYHYVSGEYDGAFVDYYPNGNVCIKGQYAYDKLDGVLEAYSENGTLNKTVAYKLGKKHGLSVYFTNGAKSKEVEFYDGFPLK